jgi:hypothetical protein
MTEVRVQAKARRPEFQGQERLVAEQLKTLMGRDPSWSLMHDSDLEFLMSMGLLVPDPSDRVKILRDAMLAVRCWGGPSRIRRRA